MGVNLLGPFMEARRWSAFGLTLIMLVSGCIGPFANNDVEPADEEDLPPVLTFNGVSDIDWGSLVPVSGTISDESPTTATVTISFSIPWGTLYETPDANGAWDFNMAGLAPGDYSVTVSATDAAGQSSESFTENFTVRSPVESQAQITIWRTQVWYEEGEEVQVTGQVEHTYLETCTVTMFYDSGDEISSDAISFDGTSGFFSLSLGELQGSVNGTAQSDCGLFTESTASVSFQVSPLDEQVIDQDGDGIPDEEDDCADGASFSSSPTTDYDADGCYDISEDLDDDNDGVGDPIDSCPKGQTGWQSTPTNDHDGDGCRDIDEDDDDDGDGIADSEDRCPGSPYGWTSNFVSDYDRDGCRDSDSDPDDDDDGIIDGLDSCPKGVIGWIPDASNDRDSDGCRDSDEDTDDDNDSVPDTNDTCPQTLPGFLVNEFGCAAYEWDSDNDGVMDDTDQCDGTPLGLVVNEQGCADLDGDGVFANVDQCPDSQDRWTADGLGCTVIQYPVPWDTGPYSINPMGRVGPMTIATTSGTWQIQNAWDGNSTYLFIFNYKSNSYMSSLWGQNVGNLLAATPDNTHIFFGSYDSDYANDIAAMESRVNNWLNAQTQEKRESWNGRIRYVDQRAGEASGSINGVINDWNAFYYAIDRFQRWRQIGSLFDWQTQSCCYRLDYIANEPAMFNKEFEVEKRREDPAITTVDVFVGERHSGGWGGGYTTKTSALLPDVATMATFNTLEVFLEHSCSEHKDRYGIDDDGDGSADRYAGCHEWDYLHYLKICDEDNSSICGTEFVRYITTYGREGRWITDISPLLWMVKNGGNRSFTYQGANGGWLNVTLMFSTWDDDGLRPTHGEKAFSGGNFNSDYNNESMYDRRYDVNTSTQWDKVEIAAIVTGHGFGQDPNNCAEFCNHEHRFSMNGKDVTHDFPEAGNSSVGSDRQGCQKSVGDGTVANQKGSWPYGRAGWCPGLDVAPWLHDITAWVNWAGQNEILYQGLWNGQQYSETSNNPNIRTLVWVIYYENTSTVGASFVEVGQPNEGLSVVGEPTQLGSNEPSPTVGIATRDENN